MSPALRAACIVMVSGTTALAAEGPALRLVPSPRKVAWSDDKPLALPKDGVAIVVGARAAAVEAAAADLLQRRVARRFGVNWPIARESEELSRYAVVILLGQPATSSLVGGLVRDRQIRVEGGGPGQDGYAIEIIPTGMHTSVLVAGANGRGVSYGQDTLFELLRREGDRLVLVQASIRDWASVAWRGRPQTEVSQHLRPGVWDCYIASRLNWIDLRNGIYAFDPDYRFSDRDRDEIARVIAEAHRRDILVYGTVNCGVPAAQYEAALGKFRQFIEWGVDGLWISFDDRGPGGAPEEITFKVLQLGLEHGMSGPRIAITPPKGSYQTVAAPFNRLLARVPGMERALWFWTVLPGEAAAADARAIGLKCRPSWWHNWPRPEGGFSQIRGRTTAADHRPPYMEIPALSVGWHAPAWSDLAPAASCVESVVPWGGQEWPEYYIAPVFGWWAWAPERHDWAAARRRIYDIVFGSAQADAMMRFDDALAGAKALFRYPIRASQWRPNCPPRLARLEDRPAALRLIAQCERTLADIGSNAPRQSLLAPEVVEEKLLAAMEQETRAGKAEAALEFPEYWWDAQQRALLQAIHDGHNGRADECIAAARTRLTGNLERIGRELDLLSLTKDYTAFWTRTARMSAADWRSVLARRQAELPRRVWAYSYFSVVIAPLLANLQDPPTGLGRGAAGRQMRVLATALPEAREQYWGDWIAGLHAEGDRKVAVFAMEPDAAARAGDYAELPVRLPLSGRRDRLGLLLFMNCWTQDKLGLEEVPGRWAGFSAAQVLMGDKLVWQGDIGLSRTGREWEVARLPLLPAEQAELSLRVRVIDRKDSSGMRGIVFVGPLRLIELPE
jgi:hypothetical protein